MAVTKENGGGANGRNVATLTTSAVPIPGPGRLVTAQLLCWGNPTSATAYIGTFALTLVNATVVNTDFTLMFWWGASPPTASTTATCNISGTYVAAAFQIYSFASSNLLIPQYYGPISAADHTTLTLPLTYLQSSSYLFRHSGFRNHDPTQQDGVMTFPDTTVIADIGTDAWGGITGTDLYSGKTDGISIPGTSMDMTTIITSTATGNAKDCHSFAVQIFPVGFTEDKPIVFYSRL